MHLDEPQVRSSEVASPPGTARKHPAHGAGRPSGLHDGGVFALALRAGVVVVLGAAIWLRFFTKSPLWLDEALTVNIASRPVHELPGLLRNDGAPPLFYLLLHYWIAAFGSGDVATRALSGLIGVVNLPLAWVTGYRVGSRCWVLRDATVEERAAGFERGRVVAWSVTLLLASSPFAVYYDTEARMYGLVLLLGTLGVLAWTFVLARPSWRGSLALAVVTSGLLYTHYWSLYLCFVVGVGCIWLAWRGPPRRAARYGLAGLVLGAASFAPWVPTFLFQLRHTGTPWATPADYTALVFAFTQFAGGNSDAGRGLALIFFFLAVLALFGLAADRVHVMLDLRTRPGIRLVTAAVVATLVVAIVAGKLSGSAFADRYTSVIAFPALLVFAYGLTTIVEPKVRAGFVAVAVALGLIASIPNAYIIRTQGGQVASAIAAGARRGDVVAYCPDQLGPSVSRVLQSRSTGLDQLTFPRADPPEIVNWVDYKAVARAASPGRFARLVEERVGAGGTIWYVWAPSYQGFGNDCQDIALDLAAHATQQVVVRERASDTPFEIFEGMYLYRFTPRR
ncbi:MAG: glycosyltransferase family 39 protein [Acidimicrobiales bacterium]